VFWYNISGGGKPSHSVARERVANCLCETVESVALKVIGKRFLGANVPKATVRINREPNVFVDVPSSELPMISGYQTIARVLRKKSSEHPFAERATKLDLRSRSSVSMRRKATWRLRRFYQIK